MYAKIMNLAGLLALLTFAASISAVLVDVAHPDGISAGARFGAVLGAVIGGDLTTIYVCMWGCRRLLRDQAPRFADAAAEIGQATADRIVELLGDRMDHTTRRASDDSLRQAGALLRDAVTGDVMAEMLDAAVRRAATYGMVVEAARRTNVATLRRD